MRMRRVETRMSCSSSGSSPSRVPSSCSSILARWKRSVLAAASVMVSEGRMSGRFFGRRRGERPPVAQSRVDGLVVVDASALDAVARQPVAHAPVGEAGHAAGLDLREAAVEREQRLGAARAGAAARGLRLVRRRARRRP